MNKRIILIIACATALGLIALLVNHGNTPGKSGRTVRLMELGVQIDVPASLSDMTYRTSASQDIGTVLHMVTDDTCEIGTIFNVSKKDIGKAQTGWTASKLQEASAFSGSQPPQAKEFTDFYLVLEPSQEPCQGSEAYMQEQTQKRSDLRSAMSSAQFIRF